MKQATRTVRFTLNRRAVSAEVTPLLTLIELVRETFGLTGTKLSCGEGECGACTVLVDGRSVNSCLFLAVDCEGREVITIEGLANEDGSLSELQQSFVREGAIQCGFCSPGMIMQARAMIDGARGELTAEMVRKGLEGNLCRCTGYEKIVQAILAVAGKGVSA